MTPKQLKLYRASRGLTQKEFGQQLGDYSESAVAAWENGRRKVPKWLVKKITENTL
jgi:transcriptional regulator with XRE-family HTH domain